MQDNGLKNYLSINDIKIGDIVVNTGNHVRNGWYGEIVKITKGNKLIHVQYHNEEAIGIKNAIDITIDGVRVYAVTTIQRHFKLLVRTENKKMQDNPLAKYIGKRVVITSETNSKRGMTGEVVAAHWSVPNDRCARHMMLSLHLETAHHRGQEKYIGQYYIISEALIKISEENMEPKTQQGGFIVWCKPQAPVAPTTLGNSIHVPSCSNLIHTTYEEAEKEAKALAKLQAGRDFYVAKLWTVSTTNNVTTTKLN